MCFVLSDIPSLFLFFLSPPLPCVLSRQLQGEWQRFITSRHDQPDQFKYPRGLALTPDEAFLLVVDGGNCRVAVLRATEGTWVRQLTGPPGTLPNPWSVASVPSTGEILVSDFNRHQVVCFRSIDDDTVVGTLGTGLGEGLTQFNFPFGLAVLDGVYCLVVCVYLNLHPILLIVFQLL